MPLLLARLALAYIHKTFGATGKRLVFMAVLGLGLVSTEAHLAQHGTALPGKPEVILVSDRGAGEPAVSRIAPRNAVPNTSGPTPTFALAGLQTRLVQRIEPLPPKGYAIYHKDKHVGGLDADSTHGLEGAEIVINAGTGDANGWKAWAGGSYVRDVKIAQTSLGDGRARYLFLTTCNVLAHGACIPLPLGGSCDYSRPGAGAAGVSDDTTHGKPKNMFERWTELQEKGHKAFHPRMRLICGGSTALSPLDAAKPWENYASPNGYSPSTAFLFGMASPSGPTVPLCLTRGGPTPSESPFSDTRFSTSANDFPENGPSYLHMQYPSFPDSSEIKLAGFQFPESSVWRELLPGYTEGPAANVPVLKLEPSLSQLWTLRTKPNSNNWSTWPRVPKHLDPGPMSPTDGAALRDSLGALLAGREASASELGRAVVSDLDHSNLTWRHFPESGGIVLSVRADKNDLVSRWNKALRPSTGMTRTGLQILTSFLERDLTKSLGFVRVTRMNFIQLKLVTRLEDVPPEQKPSDMQATFRDGCLLQTVELGVELAKLDPQLYPQQWVLPVFDAPGASSVLSCPNSDPIGLEHTGRGAEDLNPLAMQVAYTLRQLERGVLLPRIPEEAAAAAAQVELEALGLTAGGYRQEGRPVLGYRSAPAHCTQSHMFAVYRFRFAPTVNSMSEQPAAPITVEVPAQDFSDSPEFSGKQIEDFFDCSPQAED